jgi:hypothetical protein
MANFDDAHRWTDFPQRGHAERATPCVHDGVIERIRELLAFGKPGGERGLVGEWAVRHVGPDRVMAFDRLPQRCCMSGIQFLDGAVTPGERRRTGTSCRAVIDRRTHRLAGFRIDVLAHSIGPLRQP